MAVTTYCVQADVAAVLSDHGLKAFSDDDESGLEDAVNITYVIERAAVKINGHIASRYKLSDVSGDDWLKYANSVIAAAYLVTRRGNPVNMGLQGDLNAVLEDLASIRGGTFALQDRAESYGVRPAVTNFRIHRGGRRPAAQNPVRAQIALSTGNTNTPGVKRSVL